MTSRFLLFFVFAASACRAAADDVSVADLIRRLGSEKFSERERASRALERSGERVLSALAAAARSPDIETSRRALTLHKKIQERLLALRVLTPRQIEFHLKRLPLSPLLTEIRLRTGVSHVAEPGGPEKVLALESPPLPLWKALGEFWRLSGYSLSERAQTASLPDGMKPGAAYLGGGPLVLTTRTVQAPPMDDWGPLLIRALPRPDGSSANVAFVLEIRPDPLLGLQGIDGVHFTEVLDGAGQPTMTLQAADGLGNLDFFNFRDETNGTRNNGRAACMVVPIQAAGKASAMCSHIKGMLSARFLVKHPVFQVPDIAKGTGKNSMEPGGASLQVLEVETLDDGDVFIRLQLENFALLVENQPGPKVIRSGPGFVAFRGPADQAADCIELKDSRGRALPRVKKSSQPLPNKTLTGIELDLTYQGPVAPGEPLQLVLSSYYPLSLEVPFALRNVPLQR